MVTKISIASLGFGLLAILSGHADTTTPANQIGTLAVPNASILGSKPFASFTPATFAQCMNSLNGADTGGLTSDNWWQSSTFQDSAKGIIGTAITGDTSYLINGLSAAGGCDATPAPIMEASCDKYKKADGSFDNKNFTADLAKMTAAKATLNCKVKRAKNAANALECFSNDIQSMNDDMQAVKQDFDNNLNSTKQYLAAIDAAVAQQQKNKDALDTQSTAFSALQTNIAATLNKFEGKSGLSGGGFGIPDLSEAINGYQQAVTVFQQRQAREVGSRTKNCFDRGGAQSTRLSYCKGPDGSLQDPKTCILQMYQQKVAIDSAGSANVTAIDNKKAQEAVAIFQSRMKTILNQIGNSQSGGSGGSLVVSTNGTFTQTIVNSYRNEMAQRFGEVGSLFLDEVQNCYNDTQTKIKADLADPASELGQGAKQIQDSANSIATSAQSMNRALETQMRDAVVQLYGQEANQLMNTQGCGTSAVASNNGSTIQYNKADLTSQLNCAQGMYNTLQSIMNGTPPPGASAPIQVSLGVPQPLGNGQTVPMATCVGVRDCAKKAKDLSGQAQQKMDAMNGLGTFADAMCVSSGVSVGGQSGQCPGKKAMINSENNAINSAMKVASTAFQGRVAQMKQRVSQLQAMLGPIGVHLPNPKPNKDATNWTCNGGDPKDPQLCDLGSQDFPALLAGKAGVPNYDPDSLSEVRQKLESKADDELQSKLTSYESAVSNMNTMKNTCSADIAKDLAEKKKKEALAKMKQVKNTIDGCAKGVSDEYADQPEIRMQGYKALRDTAQSDLVQANKDLKDANTELNRLSQIKSGTSDYDVAIGGYDSSLKGKCLTITDANRTICNTAMATVIANQSKAVETAKNHVTELTATATTNDKALAEEIAAANKPISGQFGPIQEDVDEKVRKLLDDYNDICAAAPENCEDAIYSPPQLDNQLRQCEKVSLGKTGMKELGWSKNQSGQNGGSQSK